MKNREHEARSSSIQHPSASHTNSASMLFKTLAPQNPKKVFVHGGSPHGSHEAGLHLKQIEKVQADHFSGLIPIMS